MGQCGYFCRFQGINESLRTRIPPLFRKTIFRAFFLSCPKIHQDTKRCTSKKIEGLLKHTKSPYTTAELKAVNQPQSTFN